MTASVGQAIDSNRGLLTYPVVNPLDAVLAKFATDFLTMFVVGLLLYTGIILYYDLPVTLDLAAIFNGFLLMGLLGLGFGTLNCVIYGFWPTWRHVWNVLTKPLFIVSGMFYTFESLPPEAQAVLWYNPLIHAIGLTRSGFYAGYERRLRRAALHPGNRWRLLPDRRLPAAPAPQRPDRVLSAYCASPSARIRAIQAPSRSRLAGTTNSAIRPNVGPTSAKPRTTW